MGKLIGPVRSFIAHPLFGVGLVFRLVLIFFAAPLATSNWYVPFLQSFVVNPTLNPWSTFLQTGGAQEAFPYGIVMFLAFLPLQFAFWFFQLNPIWAYGLTILSFDFLLLVLLKRLTPISHRKLIGIYWLSPILLFACYWLGFNDVVSIALLTLCMLYLRDQKPALAGTWLGLAIASKVSMLIALPFVLVYLYRNQALRNLLTRFSLALFLTLLITGLPTALSPEAREMILSNPEMGKIYELALYPNRAASLYLLPIALLLLLYAAWAIRRVSFNLLQVLLGIAFFFVLLLTPAAPGWFVWTLPLLVYYQAHGDRIAMSIVAGFSCLYIVTVAFLVEHPVFFAIDLPGLLHNSILHLPKRGLGLLNTGLFALGLVIIYRIWTETIRKNDHFRVSRKPVVIGIAGDSGTGKDTLSQSLERLFGSHSTAQVSGDDFHSWDRHKPIWKVMTHLNPRANELSLFAQTVLQVVSGKTVRTRHYDHGKGKKSKPTLLKSNDFILVSGLHALYLPSVREAYDLSIYLDMNEDLRKFFKLQRDVNERGHAPETVINSIEKRLADSSQYIKPQSEHADLRLSLQPVRPINFNTSQSPRLRLVVRAKQTAIEDALVRQLIGLCGLHVDLQIDTAQSEVQMMIEGEAKGDDYAVCAGKLIPEMTELLDLRPLWEDGLKGLMQLIVLCYTNQQLKERLI